MTRKAKVKIKVLVEASAIVRLDSNNNIMEVEEIDEIRDILDDPELININYLIN